MLKVEMLKYETGSTMERAWIKMRTRQPEQGNVEGWGGQLAACSWLDTVENEGGKNLRWSFLTKAFLTPLYLIQPKKATLQEAEPGLHNSSETIPAALTFSFFFSIPDLNL